MSATGVIDVDSSICRILKTNCFGGCKVLSFEGLFHRFGREGGVRIPEVLAVSCVWTSLGVDAVCR